MGLSSEEKIIIHNLLIDHEGAREFPYFDCCGKFFRECRCKDQGKLTIGVGRNIEEIGISEEEYTELLETDVIKATAIVERSFFSFFKTLNSPRRIVIVSMVFNLGIRGFSQFTKMIKSIESGNFEAASKEMLNSKWAGQVKDRAIRLAEIMRTGHF